jgi:hypothetical protein
MVRAGRASITFRRDRVEEGFGPVTDASTPKVTNANDTA